MTDPHLNAEQLFGFRRRRTCVCGVCEGWFLGERMAVVSGWLVPLENFFPSFPGQRAAPTTRSEIVGEKL